MTTFKVDGRHGYGPYTKGCRCDVCREAKRQQQQRLRARRDLTNLTHGKQSTYDNGCRCDLCREAKRAADRENWRLHPEKNREKARRARERARAKRAMQCVVSVVPSPELSIREAS